MKVLIVTYYFPPVGGIGVQRVLKWIKYLPQNGIEPVVLTSGHGLGHVQDESLVNLDYIKKIKTYRLGGKKLKKYHKLKKEGKLLAPHNFFLLFRYIWGMDIFSSWYQEIKSEIDKIAKEENIDCILTTSPPHSAHLFGYHIRQNINIPWVMDLRDSLTEWPLRKKSLSTQIISFIESNYEKKFYSVADKIIFATNLMKKHAQIRKRNLLDEKAHVIRNGFDHEDFAFNNLVINKNNKFNITYTGTIHTNMDPEPFCKAVINLINIKKINTNDLFIHMVGMIDKNKKSSLETLTDFISIEFPGHVSHREALIYQASSDLLLLLAPYNKNKAEKEILTGKVFEYIGSGKPIFALASEGELADLIRENKFGYVADPNKPAEVESILLTAYQNWKQGINVVSGKNREQFSRESQCKTLSHIIEEVVEQHKTKVAS